MGMSLVEDYTMGLFQNYVKKMNMNGVVNINGIERKIYSVAAAAQSHTMLL